MRILILAASLFALAACQPETKPAQESAAAQPTPEELGQDDPDIAFEPAPVGPPRIYEAMSKTAMSFTPGKLTITPTPQQSINLPSGAVDVGDIEMYTVEGETIPPGLPNGGLCEKPFIFGVYPHTDSQGEVITVAVFTGNGWPPEKPDTALCGTFSYSAVK